MDIALLSIEKLNGMDFFIPDYQRGYRWQEQQVLDLLNDIWEFVKKEDASQIYCIQPLVVQEHNKNEQDILGRIKDAGSLQEVEQLQKTKWNVIDGQQRLTTIKILLASLGTTVTYSIDYKTRQNSKTFLDKLNESSQAQEIEKDNIDDNIDFDHMRRAKKTMDTWLSCLNGDEKQRFLKVLLEQVQFVWYEIPGTEDPIKVFTRLNIGKIPLTDAELIKALFLNRSNFSSTEDPVALQLYQVEIASEWDQVEQTLQNDEFWLFIHACDEKKSTRIDFILDQIRQDDILGLKVPWMEKWNKDHKNQTKRKNAEDAWSECIGTDDHQTFRYFYEYFKLHLDQIRRNEEKYRLRDDIWRKVKELFLIFQEWYNDLEMFHYVGFLIERGTGINTLKKIWKKFASKVDFKDELKKNIRGKLEKCKDLTQKYEEGIPKTDCLPLLLLFNIQTVINQNRVLAKNEKYGAGAIYKFPFHLYKPEAKKSSGKGWEIEHIASHAGDDLTKLESQKIYLASVQYVIEKEMATEDCQDIQDFINAPKPENFHKIVEKYHDIIEKNSIPDNYKDYIWNYALLDSTTNEEYQNLPFPVKRICVLAKERGRKAEIRLDKENHLNIDDSRAESVFVLPCTRSVFTKAYTDIPDALNRWTLKDAEAYLNKMHEVLSAAGFIDNQSDKIQNFFRDAGIGEKTHE